MDPKGKHKALRGSQLDPSADSDNDSMIIKQPHSNRERERKNPGMSTSKRINTPNDKMRLFMDHAQRTVDMKKWPGTLYSHVDGSSSASNSIVSSPKFSSNHSRQSVYGNFPSQSLSHREPLPAEIGPSQTVPIVTGKPPLSTTSAIHSGIPSQNSNTPIKPEVEQTSDPISQESSSQPAGPKYSSVPESSLLTHPNPSEVRYQEQDTSRLSETMNTVRSEAYASISASEDYPEEVPLVNGQSQQLLPPQQSQGQPIIYPTDQRRRSGSMESQITTDSVVFNHSTQPSSLQLDDETDDDELSIEIKDRMHQLNGKYERCSENCKKLLTDSSILDNVIGSIDKKDSEERERMNRRIRNGFDKRVNEKTDHISEMVINCNKQLDMISVTKKTTKLDAFASFVFNSFIEGLSLLGFLPLIILSFIKHILMIFVEDSGEKNNSSIDSSFKTKTRHHEENS